MNQTFFSIHLRRYTTYGFLFAIAFFSYLMGASASEICPSKGDHSLSAQEYKIFTAYQTAFDGYEVVCENKCFENLNCIQRCQNEKAVHSLSSYMEKTFAKQGWKKCSTVTNICLSHCKAGTENCEKACRSSESS